MHYIEPNFEKSEDVRAEKTAAAVFYFVEKHGLEALSSVSLDDKIKEFDADKKYTVGMPFDQGCLE